MTRAMLFVAAAIGRGFEIWIATLRRPLAREIAALRERNERLRAENELLRARLERIDPHARPHYKSWERLSIVWHRARYGLSLAATAKAFVIAEQTVVNWLKEVESGVQRLVTAREPMNRLPDLVRELACRLKFEWPRFGTRRIAGILANLGVKGSRSSVQRLLRGPPPRRAKAETRGRGALTAKKPNRVWLVDFTVVRGLFRTIVVGAVLDAFSRRVMTIRAWRGNPTAVAAAGLLREALARHGKPAWMITDRGTQFTSKIFARFLSRRKIRRRFGAVGRHGSITLIERFWRSAKQEFLRGLFLWLPIRTLNAKVRSYASWYNSARPHTALGLRTPDGVFHARARVRPRSVSSGKLRVTLLAGERSLPVFRLIAA